MTASRCLVTRVEVTTPDGRQFISRSPMAVLQGRYPAAGLRAVAGYEDPRSRQFALIEEVDLPAHAQLARSALRARLRRVGLAGLVATLIIRTVVTFAFKVIGAVLYVVAPFGAMACIVWFWTW